MTRPLEELARIAHEVAAEAGALALSTWRGHLDVAKKGRTDLVTQADLACEMLIQQRLRGRTPEIGIVGEEFGGEVRDGLTWYADPIDGTTNYAHGHPIWCVSIGLMEDGWPIAGAVCAPALATSWLGWRGGAALRSGPLTRDEPVRVSAVSDIGEAFLATGFPYAGREIEPDNNFATFARVKTVVQAIRRCGSAALDCCFVAEGTYDGYWERSFQPWDVAAGLAIVLAAGGRVTHLDGSEPIISNGSLLVTNGNIHDALSRLIMA